MLNSQKKPGGIETCNFTWNPIAGCWHGCPYCYLKNMEQWNPDIFEVKFRPEYIEKDLPRLQKMAPAKIFVGSSSDMWGTWVDARWIESVLDVVQECPQHTFQFLTKNPKRYGDFNLPIANAWYGTTDDGTERTAENIYLLRAGTLLPGTIRFVSFEPLLKEIDPDLFGISWVIIGSDSNKGAARPPGQWAWTIMRTARHFDIPIWMKDNYRYPCRIKEFPQ